MPYIRVFQFRETPKLYILEGRLENQCTWSPSFTARRSGA